MRLSIDKVTAWRLRCHDCSCFQSEIFESEALAREALDQDRVCEQCWSQLLAKQNLA
jgi:rRNA maturation endonuclease Nob1